MRDLTKLVPDRTVVRYRKYSHRNRNRHKELFCAAVVDHRIYSSDANLPCFNRFVKPGCVDHLMLLSSGDEIYCSLDLSTGECKPASGKTEGFVLCLE